MNTTTTKTAAITYSYKQRSGKYAKRNLVCAAVEVEVHLARLNADVNARNVHICK